MQKKLKIYHPNGWQGGWSHYTNWMGERELVNSLDEADLVLFAGGTDVESVHYNEPAHPRAEYPDRERDKTEIAIYKDAIKLGKKIVGVCRGSQLTSVQAGGRLVQHQGGQDYIHKMKTSDGSTVLTTSTHHQAQYPFEMKEGEDYKLLAWTEGLSSFHYDGEGNEMNPEKEAEVVYYPKINALAIQGHPEDLDSEEDLKYFKNLLNKLLEGTL